MTTFLVTAALGLFAAPDGAASVVQGASDATVQQRDQDDAAPQRRRGQEGQQRGRRPDQPQRDRRDRPGGFGRFTPPQQPLMTALDTDNDGVISAEEIEKAAAALKKLDQDEDGKLSAEELRAVPGRGFGDREAGGRGAFGARGGFGRRGPFGGRGQPDERDAGELGQRRGRGGFGPGGIGRGGFGGRPGGDQGAPRGAFGFAAPNSVEGILSRDQNGDGKVTKDEWLAPLERIFDRADANGDGALDKEEMDRIAERFQPRDVGDGRGRPGFGGFGGRGANFAARLMQLDANGDGKVTKDEVPEGMQRMFERLDANGDGAIDKAEAEQAAQAFGARRGGRSGPRDGRPRRRPEADDATPRGERDNPPRNESQAE